MLLCRLYWLLLPDGFDGRFHHEDAALATIFATVRPMKATVHFDIVIEIVFHVLDIVDHLFLVR